MLMGGLGRFKPVFFCEGNASFFANKKSGHHGDSRWMLDLSWVCLLDGCAGKSYIYMAFSNG